MKKAIIGKKVGMTQIFDESGKVIPVTVVEAGPCVVTQKKTVETDGYTAVQLGFENVKESKLTKPEAGHLKKAGVEAKKHLKEFKLEAAADMNVGDVVKADTFAAGDWIDVTGTASAEEALARVATALELRREAGDADGELDAYARGLAAWPDEGAAPR